VRTAAIGVVILNTGVKTDTNTAATGQIVVSPSAWYYRIRKLKITSSVSQKKSLSVGF